MGWGMLTANKKMLGMVQALPRRKWKELMLVKSIEMRRLRPASKGNEDIEDLDPRDLEGSTVAKPGEDIIEVPIYDDD